MTAYRTLQGIPFRALSPSHFEIDGRAHPTSFIDLCVVHLCEDRLWYIDVLMKAGHSIHRGPFRSRDAAIALIAGQTLGVSA